MAINYALASEGATLTGTNAYGSGLGTDYDITWANNGGSPLYDGNPAHNWPPSTPDNLVVNLSGDTTVSSVVLWFADFDTRNTDPGPTDLGNYPAVDFTISTWNGASWDVQSTITGNDKLTRTITIADVQTTKIKFAWTVDTGGGFIGLQEIEVWGTQASGDGLAAGSSTAGGVNDSTREPTIAAGATITTFVNVAVGSAVGVATAPAVGMPGIHQGAGSVSCVSWSRAKPPYTIKALDPSLITVDEFYYTGIGNNTIVNPITIDDRHRAHDGINYGVAKGAQFYQYGGTPAMRLSLAAPGWVVGVRIYSGTAALENRTTEPPDDAVGSITYSGSDVWYADVVLRAIAVAGPENVAAPSPQFVNLGGGYGVGYLDVSNGARIGAWSWSSTADAPTPGDGLPPTGVHADEAASFPPILYKSHEATRPALAKRTLLFKDTALFTQEKHTSYVDVCFCGPSSTRLYEVQLLYISLDILGECLDTAEATDSHILYHIVTATPDVANATSTISGYDVAECVSTANITNPLSGSKLHVEAWVDTAVATSVVSFARVVTAVSTANATAPVSQLPRTVALVSTANAVATVVDTFVAKATYVSTANAVSVLAGARRVTLTSTANATSRVLLSQGTLIELQSSAAASSVVLLKNNLMTLQSYAVASSVVSTKLLAHQILLSSADATSYVILANTVLQSVWVNPTTTALGTWSGTPFESMAEMNGEMYAAGVAGVYVLEDQSSDAGAAINAELRWDLFSYSSVQRHRPGEVYLGGQAAGSLNVRVSNEQGVFNYPTQLSGNTKDTNLRARIGKGVSSRFIRIALTNPNGVHFSINEAQVEVIELARQVGGKHG